MYYSFTEEKEPLEILLQCINNCVKSKLYIEAMVLSLAIPDVCSKIEKNCKSSKNAYIEWFDSNVDYYPNDMDLPCLDGATCYSLRCSLFHAFDSKLDEKLKIDNVVFVDDTRLGFNYCGVGGECTTNVSGNSRTTRYVTVNIKEFVSKLYNAGLGFYKSEIYIDSGEHLVFRFISSEPKSK